jgi:nucleoside-triphosphatase
MDLARPHLWMLSGGRGVGKTTFCRVIAEQAHAGRWQVAGLLSPGIFEGDVKTGIRAEDLRTGETRPLAQATPAAGFDLQLGRWYFDPAVFAWGNEVLENSLPCDLFIVDELGPLEFVQSRGWTAALPTLRQSRYRLGLVVVRPELQAAALRVLPIGGSMHLDEPQKVDEIARSWWEESLREADTNHR